MANDATFDTSVTKTTVNAGEKRVGPYSVVCKITATVTVTVTRGLIAKPEVTSSFDLHAKSARYAVSGGYWYPSFEDAEGTIVSERAYRSNEAGFWEKETTTEVRTATLTAWDRTTGTALTPTT